MLASHKIMAFAPTLDANKARPFYEGVLGLPVVSQDNFALALDANGIMLRVNGARRDVFPSAMLRQTSQGRMAYVHTLPRSKMRAVAVDIFEPAPPEAQLATVDEQRAWHDHWAQSQG